jgi:hypothetical protein
VVWTVELLPALAWYCFITGELDDEGDAEEKVKSVLLVCEGVVSAQTF